MQLFDKLAKLDTFTRKQIVNEFEGTLFVKPQLDTVSNEHFTPRKFDMNEFYGGFLIVIAVIFLVAKVMG